MRQLDNSSRYRSCAIAIFFLATTANLTLAATIEANITACPVYFVNCSAVSGPRISDECLLRSDASLEYNGQLQAAIVIQFLIDGTSKSAATCDANSIEVRSANQNLDVQLLARDGNGLAAFTGSPVLLKAPDLLFRRLSSLLVQNITFTGDCPKLLVDEVTEVRLKSLVFQDDESFRTLEFYDSRVIM